MEKSTAEVDELLATIDETIAQVRGMIEGQEALMAAVPVHDKDAEDALNVLQDALIRFTTYREYVARKR